MPYLIRVEGRFAAAHALRGYGGACERLHGHNFGVIAVAEVEDVGHDGIALDFKWFSSLLNNILKELDHQNLNDLKPFREKNATAENVAAFIYRRLGPDIEAAAAKLYEVTVEESPKYGATFKPKD